MPELRVVYITFSSREEAKKLASFLLEQNLIACANIYKIDSLYKWKGKVMDEAEFVLWAKTSSERIESIEKLVKENHSYDLPCIAHFGADANQDYKDWVFKESSSNNF